MSRQTFHVKAIWDAEAAVFYSESDIIGLHIEAADLDTLEQILLTEAADLVVANHSSNADVGRTPIEHLIPTILWQQPIIPPAA